MEETGQLDKIKRVWILDNNKDCSEVSSESLGMGTLYSIFAFMLIIFIFTLILLIIEKVFKSLKTHKSSRSETLH